MKEMVRGKTCDGILWVFWVVLLCYGTRGLAKFKGTKDFEGK